MVSGIGPKSVHVLVTSMNYIWNHEKTLLSNQIVLNGLVAISQCFFHRNGQWRHQKSIKRSRNTTAMRLLPCRWHRLDYISKRLPLASEPQSNTAVTTAANTAANTKAAPQHWRHHKGARRNKVTAAAFSLATVKHRPLSLMLMMDALVSVGPEAVSVFISLSLLQLKPKGCVGSFPLMGTKCRETERRGRAVKIKSRCTTAPMGAIVEYYRAFSDLGLHTGYVIHIYAYIFTYIYMCKWLGGNWFLD